MDITVKIPQRIIDIIVERGFQDRFIRPIFNLYLNDIINGSNINFEIWMKSSRWKTLEIK
jgi:hypothetical protein